MSSTDWYSTFFCNKNFADEKSYFLGSWQLAAHISEIKSLIYCIQWLGGFLSFDCKGELSVVYHPTNANVQKLDVKICDGFIFVKVPGFDQPDIEKMSLFSKGISLTALAPLEELVIKANWKLLVDISLDETHVHEVHPEYGGTFGGAYDYVKMGIKRSWRQKILYDSQTSLNRMYSQCLSIVLPQQKHYWEYIWIFPATEIEIYPEQIAYYQIIPLDETSTLKRHRRLGLRTINPIYSLMRRLNYKMQSQIDRQDIDAVLLRQKVATSIEPIKLYPGQGDRLVLKFYETIKNRKCRNY